MTDIMKFFFKKLGDYNAQEFSPTRHPHNTALTTSWIVLVAIFTVLYFFLYNYPVGLHDISHYVTAGVSQIRDHKDLLYPYNNTQPGMEPAYEYFQNNNIHFDTRINYPSKLYSALYGLIYSITGEIRFSYAQWLSLGALIMCNVFLYLIGSRFFTGVTLACLIISVAFLPVMRFSLNPGSDTFGYLTCLILLWSCICARLNLFVIGLIAGLFFHFRAQSLSLVLIIPFITSRLYGRKLLSQSAVPMLFGAVISYVLLGTIFKLLIDSASDSNPISFYINFFKSSFYHISDLSIIGDKFLKNFKALFDSSQLYFFAYTLFFCFLMRKKTLPKALALGGLLYIAVPISIYSLDRFSPPQARYYISAVPMIVLAWFIAVKALDGTRGIHSTRIIVVTAILVVCSWYDAHGFPIRYLAAPELVSRRLSFLDFKDVEATLRSTFKEDDIVVVNHSLPTGLSRLHNVIYAPSFERFKAGDNREIDGIIFVYSNQSPNNFFKPNDWLVDGKLPDKISDDNATTFKMVYSASSALPNLDGTIESDAHFYIFKNTDVARKTSRDTSGRRTFYAEPGRGLSSERILSPTFSESNVWGPGYDKARIGDDQGVVVGPGPDNLNVLYQRFPASPGETFRIVAKASSASGTHAKGRIQINWLDANDKFITTSIKVFETNGVEKIYTAFVTAPDNIKWAMVYVSPNGEQDVVRYTEMRVFGK